MVVFGFLLDIDLTRYSMTSSWKSSPTEWRFRTAGTRPPWLSTHKFQVNDYYCPIVFHETDSLCTIICVLKVWLFANHCGSPACSGCVKTYTQIKYDKCMPFEMHWYCISLWYDQRLSWNLVRVLSKPKLRVEPLSSSTTLRDCEGTK